MSQSRTSIATRHPRTAAAELVKQLVPPRQFRTATFDSYRPDPEFPSQEEAVSKMRQLRDAWAGKGRGLFKRVPKVKPGIYLDGGFGVGKTHLLAALWKSVAGRKYFGTFIEYTALVGALGYKEAIDALKGASLVAIDEFELDDPGDTMVMTRLLGELVASGTKIAATSNTPPNALGEGRFAARDFLREIQAISDRFEIMRIDGHDYRQRDLDGSAEVYTGAELDSIVAEEGGTIAVDEFQPLVEHLSSVHPSRYVDLVSGIEGAVLRDVRQLTDQNEALRFVALVDRLYDSQVRIWASGTPLDEVFSDDMLGGGYRKKYMRAVSRLNALTSGQF
ncbi:cell division protein ZapE [uncultured Agrococcus sp.]|uniref:cell division protein ZapE n=1 Tax=uncultured Agrococcus sp. TaxID=382258 RepID=UPI0025D20364|nr:cell division protein ZapE [uncultured Agrococcus sp.]